MSQGIKFMPWWWEAAPSIRLARQPLPPEIDVAVVGSGYTGLSAALTLARAGRSVLVLDANSVGYGASTRNNGQVGSGNQKFTVQRLVDLYGRKRAIDLVNAGTDMLRYIAELIGKEKINCEFHRVGRFRGAVASAHYDTMARDLEDLKRFAGVEFFMVPKAEQHREVGTECYFGGSVLPDDAALHPGLYHQGLIACALSAGVSILDHTPVLSVKRKANSFEVQTTRGLINSGVVVVATNGYSQRCLPYFHKRLVPIGVSTIATEELSRSVIKELLPHGRVYGSTARVFHYYRPSSDGKCLLFGGRVGRLAPRDTYLAYRHLIREMRRVFPSLEDVGITHAWSGYIAYTSDTLPHLGFHDGVWYAAGYCGTGVSRSTWFGHKVALKILGDPDGKTPFDDLDFKGFPFRWAAPVGVAAFETCFRVIDALARIRHE